MMMATSSQAVVLQMRWAHGSQNPGTQRSSCQLASTPLGFVFQGHARSVWSSSCRHHVPAGASGMAANESLQLSSPTTCSRGALCQLSQHSVSCSGFLLPQQKLFLRCRRNRLSMAAPPTLGFPGTAVEPVCLPFSVSPSPGPSPPPVLSPGPAQALLTTTKASPPPQSCGIWGLVTDAAGANAPFSGGVLRVCSRRAGPVKLRVELWMDTSVFSLWAGTSEWCSKEKFYEVLRALWASPGDIWKLLPLSILYFLIEKTMFPFQPQKKVKC